jgi:phosphate transport system protein
MTQMETEIGAVKSEVLSMWNLVESQLQKVRTAMLHMDRDLAREVVLKEKRVNAFELKIDRDCENVFALFCPVAVDLRFLLAALKINTNLERIGDIAEGIGRYVIENAGEFDHAIFEHTRLNQMFEEAINILQDTRIAFENEDTTLARSIFKRDEVLDAINVDAIDVIAKSIADNPEITRDALYVLSIIRKLERAGDQTKNMAEEIIFYVEAKVIKHVNKT